MTTDLTLLFYRIKRLLNDPNILLGSDQIYLELLHATQFLHVQISIFEYEVKIKNWA